MRRTARNDVLRPLAWQPQAAVRLVNWSRDRTRVPVLMAQVDLDEGVRMNTNLVGIDAADAKVGMKLQVTFEISPTGEAIPVFERA